MAGKGSKPKSKKTWTCEHKCKMTDGKPCKHLEKLLPSMEQGVDRHWLKYFPYLDRLNVDPDAGPANLTDTQVKKFVLFLKNCGLQEHHIIILVDKYAYGKTFKEITQDHGFTSLGVTHFLCKQAETIVKKVLERKAKQ